MPCSSAGWPLRPSASSTTALQIRARWQLAGQLVVALGAVALGVTVDSIANPVGPGQIALGAFALAFTSSGSSG